MNPKTPLCWRIVCAAFGFVCADAVQAADEPTGIMEGRVLNSAKSEYVGNARLTVEGTLLEAFTQSDGSYRLTNVPAGTVTVKAFFTGLPSQTSTVRVVGGQSTQVDLDFAGSGEGVVKLSEFVVSTSRDMSGAAIAINE